MMVSIYTLRVLLDIGYLCMADFGLSKVMGAKNLTNSFCGTPEYLAPEMLIGNGHDYTLDWWAFGILLYELIVGIPPFYSKNKNLMYRFIKEMDLQWPDVKRHKIDISPEAKDLISKLLHKNKRQRLGAKGSQEII